MCGRFAIRFTGPKLIRDLALGGEVQANAELTPRYNIAPTQTIPALRLAESLDYQLDLLRWGLVPHWSNGPDSRYAMHNARLEHIETKPAYRKPLARQRCLIPADGWYEWQTRKQASGKQAYFIHRPGNALFCFAGIWDRWREASGSVLESCSIITTAAHSQIRMIHSRMPLVLNPADYQQWLNPGLIDKTRICSLLTDTRHEDFQVIPVSRHVNNAGNDDPRCIEALAGTVVQTPSPDITA